MTTATAFFLMALVYALVDAYKKWDGEPFIYAGILCNSSFLFFLKKVSSDEIYKNQFQIYFRNELNRVVFGPSNRLENGPLQLHQRAHEYSLCQFSRIHLDRFCLVNRSLHFVSQKSIYHSMIINIKLMKSVKLLISVL